MTSKLGMHWQRTHSDNREDFAHIEAMQYKSVKLFKNEWDNVDFCRDLLAVLRPDAHILARDHALSEQKEDMWGDAQAAGIDHANQWINKVKSGQYHLPLDRTFFLGINEPDATHGDRNKIDIYTASFLHQLQNNGLRGGAFNFSTGHPRTVDGTPNTPADYSVFERSHQAIVAGNHIGVLHIYGTGAVPCAPGHYDRLQACTWRDVEWVVGEIGADEYVIGGGAHIGFHGYFHGRLNDYCAWLDTLILGINDARIHSYQVFTYDHASPWETFDTHPIRDALESYQWRHMTQPPTPSTPPGEQVFLPGIGTDSGTPPTPVQPVMAHVSAPNGANLRETPDTTTEGSNVIMAVPYGEIVTILKVVQGEGNVPWARVQYGDITGYIRDDLLGGKPADAPQPPPPAPSEPVGGGIIDPRVAKAILNIESGGRTHGENGRPIIRFEAHVFENNLSNTDYFRYNLHKPWTEQEWRRSTNDSWKPIHTGKQADEYAAFEFAKSIDRNAAYESISMGAGQLMGFHASRLGFPNAEAMFNAFEDGQVQTIAFINYFLRDPALLDAMRRRDWREIAKRYNGASNVDVYAPLLEKAYREASR